MSLSGTVGEMVVTSLFAPHDPSRPVEGRVIGEELRDKPSPHVVLTIIEVPSFDEREVPLTEVLLRISPSL